MKKIIGHLEEKNGKYYAAVNHYDLYGKRKVKWYPLDLEVRAGTKREANHRLTTLLAKLNSGNNYLTDAMNPAERERHRIANMPVEDYLYEWLDGHKRNVSKTTYDGYKKYIDLRIVPFFKELNLKVNEVTGDEINQFYERLTDEGLKGTSMQRYHSVLHLAFKSAFKRRILPANPVDQADRPKAQQYIADYYNPEEMKKLLEVSRDDELHLIILLACFYGLRRSEILGLKWSAIDFSEGDKGSIAIRHKVVEESDGVVGYDVMKTKSSFRTLPLLPNIREALLEEKAKQKEMQEMFGKGYNKDYLDYVNVDAIGNIYNPDYVSEHFSVLLKRHGLRKIRFHDLRHSCASTMLALGKQMKDIQMWLGHSDIGTTGNIYSHLDSHSKVQTGAAIYDALTD